MYKNFVSDVLLLSYFFLINYLETLLEQYNYRKYISRLKKNYQLFRKYIVKLYHYFVVIGNNIYVLVIDRTPRPLTLI